MNEKREAPRADEQEQLDAFLREMRLFDRELSALKHRSVTYELIEELHECRHHLDTLFRTGGTSRRLENIDLFFDICQALSSRQDPLTMGEISQIMNVPLSTATRHIDWMVESHFARRLSDPDDRRVVRVSLTEEGIELYHGLSQFMRKRTAGILEHFTDEEKPLLISLMNKFAAILAKEKSRRSSPRFAGK
jgi:DNA-binding MarR family transcriptional regulator